MDRFGLLDSDIAYLTQLFIKHAEIQYVIVFGSRAKGNYKNGSDVDVAIKSQSLSNEELNTIDNELNENSNLPYKFDIVHYEKIQTPELKDHIDRIGKRLFITPPKNQDNF
jgi:predicted nucleotidyltransferase